MMDRYELVIVGGGMAGLSLLAKLAPAIAQGMTVALIDPAAHTATFESLSPSFDDRATALSGATIEQLTQLNMPELEAALTDIKQIEVSDKGHLGYHLMSSAEQNKPRFGAIIANRALGALLVKTTQPLAAQRFFKTEVNHLRPLADGYLLELTNQISIQAERVVLCDGGRSTLAEQVGLSARRFPFHARARVATVKTSEPHQGRAFERFTSKGPIALLPFGEFSTLVWTIDNQMYDHTPHTKPAALAWLNSQFGQRSGQITHISDWVEYPLCERTLSTNVTHNLIALGNSAATLHPVAGQGFNLAMRGISRTANVINQQYLRSKTMPSFSQLNQLGQAIQHDQTITAQLSRDLIRAFGAKNPLIQLGRGIGLGSLDRHPLLSDLLGLAGMGHLAKISSNAEHRF